MTDDEIRDVFAELRRIGVDLGTPPGLALGTGFRDGEFLPWLRTLPDNLGHDAFVERLSAHVNAAQPNVPAGVPRGLGGRPHRQWPTVEQMHAGIDILVREWDPLGARLGELSTEDVTHPVAHALGVVLSGQEPDLIQRRISTILGSVEQEVFGLRPSPREQRRYLARRLIQVVIDNPGPAHEEDAFEEFGRAAEASMAIARAEGRLEETHTKMTSGVTVCFGPRGDELPALDPQALCSECGTTGTVAVVEREVEPVVSRYCPSCWGRVRERYVDRFWNRPAKPEEQTTPEALIAAFDAIRDTMLFQARERVRYTASALWEDRLPFIEASLAPNERLSPENRERHLRQMARGVASLAPKMYGPMPPEIADFVERYGSSDA